MLVHKINTSDLVVVKPHPIFDNVADAPALVIPSYHSLPDMRPNCFNNGDRRERQGPLRFIWTLILFFSSQKEME
ncbi:hypothetical protein KIN20_006019 [Parelaphostrongylus tenuis]|uniref:Uncharacterized protein n=1 Tax=Parelaphostrongylus tenuis TaxID=148309 RepID=A0AAD5M311_PARTN|nr:hypothetical protein KIN20_006019 [Parelaphostrongylus tenuis]